VEGEFLGAPDQLNGYHVILIGGGTNGFIGLHTLNGCLMVSFPFLLLYRFVQPTESVSTEGENIFPRLHMMFPGPGNTCSMNSLLTIRLWSLVIILLALSLYFSTLLTSKFAMVLTDVPFYKAIHRCMH